MWNNIGLIKAKNLDSEHFTSDVGIKIRRIINPVVRKVVSKTIDKEIVVLDYPVLDKNEAFIFAGGHLFPGEIESNISVIDRNAYVLIGTTDQVDHNPSMYGAWINGMIYVNKLNQDSRTESQKKIKRILNSGSSVLMFPEGVLNNSENLLIMPLYPGIYYMSLETGKRIVPIVSHTENGMDKIYVKAGKPICFEGLSKLEALKLLRDELATLRFDIISKLEPLERKKLTGDIHQQHMEYRRDVYREVKWHSDVWDEEIMVYHGHDIVSPEEVRATFDSVDITPANANIFGPTLVKRLEDKKYDFKNYMKENWNK